MVCLITVYLRPDKRQTLRYQLDSDDWKNCFKQQNLLLENVTLHNEGLQDVYISTDDSEPSGNNYDRLGPDGIVSLGLNPMQINLKRSDAKSIPTVVVSYTYWSREYVDKMGKMYGDLVHIVLGGGR